MLQRRRNKRRRSYTSPPSIEDVVSMMEEDDEEEEERRRQSQNLVVKPIVKRRPCYKQLALSSSSLYKMTSQKTAKVTLTSPSPPQTKSPKSLSKEQTTHQSSFSSFQTRSEFKLPTKVKQELSPAQHPCSILYTPTLLLEKSRSSAIYKIESSNVRYKTPPKQEEQRGDGERHLKSMTRHCDHAPDDVLVKQKLVKDEVIVSPSSSLFESVTPIYSKLEENSLKDTGIEPSKMTTGVMTETKNTTAPVDATIQTATTNISNIGATEPKKITDAPMTSDHAKTKASITTSVFSASTLTTSFNSCIIL
mmetsp:Transcript_13161/g.19642  ORF Transcript_13161/g.19642 Transcript_13161/m.19642 type:complete len:307 (-) Transcript_13161:71-991(-)